MERRELLHLGVAAALAMPFGRRRGPVRIALALDDAPGGGAGSNGALFGFEEASHTWTLLGREIEAASAEDPSAAALVSLVHAPPHHALTIDARVRYDCTDDTAAFRVGLPDAAGALWLPTLERYGAAQLNERFARRFGTPMDEHAWAAWFAVKLIAECLLRARSEDPAVLTRWLLSERARFDGHKGRPLAFDAQRRLVQPAYAPDGTVMVTEVLCAS